MKKYIKYIIYSFVSVTTLIIGIFVIAGKNSVEAGAGGKNASGTVCIEWSSNGSATHSTSEVVKQAAGATETTRIKDHCHVRSQGYVSSGDDDDGGDGGGTMGDYKVINN